MSRTPMTVSLVLAGLVPGAALGAGGDRSAAAPHVLTHTLAPGEPMLVDGRPAVDWPGSRAAGRSCAEATDGPSTRRSAEG